MVTITFSIEFCYSVTYPVRFVKTQAIFFGMVLIISSSLVVSLLISTRKQFLKAFIFATLDENQDHAENLV